MKYKLDRKHLKGQRKFKGISQKQLAARAGVSQAMINMIESGKKTPGLKTFLDIVAALECSPGLFFTKDKNNDRNC